MATNFIQRGENLTIPAPAAVNSGAPVIVGSIRGIALGDAASGDSVDVATTGVFRLSKVGADVMAVGDTVYWDSAAELVTTTATDNDELGVAVEAAGSGAGTVSVRIGSF